jgi:hypothetical protein
MNGDEKYFDEGYCKNCGLKHCNENKFDLVLMIYQMLGGAVVGGFLIWSSVRCLT